MTGGKLSHSTPQDDCSGSSATGLPPPTATNPAAAGHSGKRNKKKIYTRVVLIWQFLGQRLGDNNCMRMEKLEPVKSPNLEPKRCSMIPTL